MKAEDLVSVDVRALGDLRARTERAERLLAAAEKEHARLTGDIADLTEIRGSLMAQHDELAADLADARAEASKVSGLDAQIEKLSMERERADGLELDLLAARERVGDMERNTADLTEALRAAQVEYWELVQTVRDQKAELTQSAERHRKQAARVDELKSQLDRITSSRAWRLISVYRRFVNRLRGRSA